MLAPPVKRHYTFRLPPVWFVATGDVVPVRSIPDIDLMEVMQRI
jgi:hypothetical protein